MEKEIWKDIPGHEGIYQISDFGRIRGLERTVKHPTGSSKKIKGQIIKKKKIWSGYEHVCLCKNGIKKYYSVHRLVLKTFIPIEEQNILQVNHINGIKNDNCLKNLEWCTSSQNVKHSFSILKRKPTKFWLNAFGYKNPNSKAIIQKDLKGNIVAHFDSSATAARELNLNEDSISRASRKERKTAYGYIWERVNI